MPESVKKLIWPVAALLLLLAFNLCFNVKFFYFSYGDGRLSGAMVAVLLNAVPVMLVALGMTLVIATGGIDLSVGAVAAMAGSLAAVLLVQFHVPVFIAVLVALAACAVAGLWNGVLVAYLRMQPIVATLVLMVAGRGIAQLLTNSQKIPLESYPQFTVLGLGKLLGLPLPVWIVALVAVIVAVLMRRTALGLMVEAVGGSETASRFAGIDVRFIRLAAYSVCGLFAGLAGIVFTANFTEADPANTGRYWELDAILAVVIGGTSLTGGRFSLLGSLLGVVIIETLNTTIQMTQLGGSSIPPEYNRVAKAIVVIVVCLLQSATFQQWLTRRREGA